MVSNATIPLVDTMSLASHSSASPRYSAYQMRHFRGKPRNSHSRCHFRGLFDGNLRYNGRRRATSQSYSNLGPLEAKQKRRGLELSLPLHWTSSQVTSPLGTGSTVQPIVQVAHDQVRGQCEIRTPGDRLRHRLQAQRLAVGYALVCTQYPFEIPSHDLTCTVLACHVDLCALTDRGRVMVTDSLLANRRSNDQLLYSLVRSIGPAVWSVKRAVSLRFFRDTRS